MTNYSSIRYASSGTTGSGTTVYADMNALIAATGTDGAQAFVQSNNNIYVYAGTGWYKIATVQNDSPSAITGVSGSYSLAIDGTPTVITAVSTDPEGFPLTWSYSTSGLGSIATISQVDNVFTITPSTTEEDTGTFTLTINATDGVNGAVSANTSITLQFIITNINYTTLLATAVDTSYNNNITDSSTNNHTIAGTNPFAGTFSPYRHGGYSTYFDGTGDYIRYQDASLAEGTDDFTVEFWVSRNGTQSLNDTIVGHDTTPGWQICFNSDGSTIRWMSNATDASRVLPASLNDQQWHHIVYQRSSGTLQGFLDGVSLGTASVTTNFTNNIIEIGVNRGGTAYFNGHVRDVRIIKGTAFYSSSGFDVPTKPLTAVSDTGYSTTLLSCHLPYIADGGANSLSPTVNGNTSTKPFSPYDYGEYSESNNGGSVYFDGDVDHLEGPSVDIMGNGAFTVECWVYILSNTTGTTDAFLAQYQTNNKFIIGVKSDVVRVWMSGSEVRVGTTNIINNGWHHIALVRDSSNSCQLYVDGVTEGAAFTNSTDFSTSLENFEIGSWDAGNNSDLHGYISDLRVVKGTAVYTSAFTPPTAPLSTISGTTLHIKGTDASIIDKSQANNLKLVGNTTGSTTQVKFVDTKSMYFDGSGDSVSITPDYDDPLFNFGTVDWTIEVWAYIQTLSSGRNLISFLRASTNETVPHIYTQDTGLRYYVNNTDVITSTNVLTLNTWHHIALTRNGNDHKLFVDGTQVGNTWTSAQTYVQGRPVLGDYHSSLGNLTGGTNLLHGYAQDFRITKGLARYTANFTPPTEPLKG